MAYYGNILEEELKNKVAHDLFDNFDTTQIIGRIDFCVSIPADPLGLNEAESLLWAEAKKGTTIISSQWHVSSLTPRSTIYASTSKALRPQRVASSR